MELSEKSKTFPLTVVRPVLWGFFGHRPKLFPNEQKNLSQFGHNVIFSQTKMSQNVKND